MRSSLRSSMRFGWRLVAILVFAGGLAWSVGDQRPVPSPGLRFVDAVGQRLAIREIPCTGVTELPGEVHCGEVAAGAPVFRAAHDEAMALAARELPVLDVRLQDGVPPNQLAELPGFEPAPKIPGLAHRIYLIAESRIGVWVDVASRDEEKIRVFFTVEELSGPFPDYFPAVEK